MTATTVPALLAETAARTPNAPALVDGPVRLSWGQLRERSQQIARALLSVGVAPGDRVMILGPNGHQWVLASLGAHSVGATVVPVNTRYTGYEIVDLLRRSRTTVLFAVSGFLGRSFVDMIRAAASDEEGTSERVANPAIPVPGIDSLHTVVSWTDPGSGAPTPPGALSWEGLLALAERTNPAEAMHRAAAVGPDDLADIVFTSGTTGRSKGALSRQRQTVDCARAWAETVGLTPADNYLIVAPFAHTFGYKAGIVACLASGATMLPMPTFDADATIQKLRQEQVTVLPGPPTIFQTLLDHPDLPAPDELSWRVAVTGSATVPERLVERMYQELGLQTVLTGYGLSEAVTVSMSALDDPADRVVTSAGRAIAGFEIRIRDTRGRVLGPEEAGEIEVRGPNVMVGYMDDEEATAEAIDVEGWLRTGDIGSLDADGYLTITDRIKDMFTVGGFNVYPAEIEHVLSHLPGVSESCVVGIPDERLGSVGKAFIIAEHDQRLTVEMVKAHLKTRLANFKVPRAIEFVSDFPRNHAGKVLKRVLAASDSRPRQPGLTESSPLSETRPGGADTVKRSEA